MFIGLPQYVYGLMEDGNQLVPASFTRHTDRVTGCVKGARRIHELPHGCGSVTFIRSRLATLAFPPRGLPHSAFCGVV